MNAELQQTEIGKLPSTWEINRVDPACEIQQGKQVSKKNHKGGNQRPLLSELTMALPSLEEQRQISYTLDACEAKTGTAMRKANSLQDLFRTLLHEPDNREGSRSQRHHLMKIQDITVQNFRLLENVKLCLEDNTTLIVGRNNSGKTSLTDLFRKLLDERSPILFDLEDFSLGTHERFWTALVLFRDKGEDEEIRQSLPVISINLTVSYSESEELGTLSDFVVDLDEACTTAKVVVSYELAPGKIGDLFDGLRRRPCRLLQSTS